MGKLWHSPHSVANAVYYTSISHITGQQEFYLQCLPWMCVDRTQTTQDRLHHNNTPTLTPTILRCTLIVVCTLKIGVVLQYL